MVWSEKDRKHLCVLTGWWVARSAEVESEWSWIILSDQENCVTSIRSRKVLTLTHTHTCLDFILNYILDLYGCSQVMENSNWDLTAKEILRDIWGERMAVWQRSREWNDVSINQGVSSLAGKHWKLEEAPFQKEQDPTDVFISDFQPSGLWDNTFSCLGPPSLENCLRIAGLNQ